MTEKTSNTTSGQNVPKSPKGLKTKKSKFRMESEQEKISKSKLRMERREDKLNRARKKLDGKKPPKPRGPVRRALGAAGWNVHGFVHGKIYEVEHENVGTEVANEFYIEPFGTGNETPPPAPGSPPGTAAQGLPVLRLSLLAGHPLRLLLSEPFEKAGREVILCAS